MKASDFVENEQFIRKQTSGFSVALDGSPKRGKTPKGDEPEYAAQVGVIISLFALVEDYVPYILQSLTGLGERDAMSIMGVFRAFSNRLELLRAVYKPRGDKSVDFIIGKHFMGLLAEANKIRNRYAHAEYSTSRTAMHLRTFSGDYNRNLEILTLTLDDFKADAARLRRIICELHAFVRRREISSGLHVQLQKLSP